MSTFSKQTFATVFLLSSFSLQAATIQPALTLKTAMTMAEACFDLARKENWQVAVAVMDNGGNLKYFARMDGVSLLSSELSRDKALTSAKIALSTKKLSQMSESEPTIRGIPGIVLAHGGLPIIQGEIHIGGIGVSGATPEQDITCAEAGLSVLPTAK